MRANQLRLWFALPRLLTCGCVPLRYRALFAKAPPGIAADVYGHRRKLFVAHCSPAPGAPAKVTIRGVIGAASAQQGVGASSQAPLMSLMYSVGIAGIKAVAR
jgi:hypothetical protein